MLIFSQLLGFGATISLFVGYQQKKRRGLLFSKLCADAFWVAHYLCLCGFAGAIPNAVGIVREIVYMQRNKLKSGNRFVIPSIFLAINWTLGAISFNTITDLLPILASSFVTVALWIDNTRLTKIICLPVSLAFAIYDFFVLSYVGIFNEAISMISIIIYFIKENKKMKNNFFKTDYVTTNELITLDGAPIKNCAAFIHANADEKALELGYEFSNEIERNFITDLEKAGDKMAHVSTFVVMNKTLIATYYANTKEPSEDPKNQTARLVYAPIDDIENKTFIDLQTTGDCVGGKIVDMVYDTILMQKDDDVVFVMWTARVEENYYRFYRPFNVTTKTLGDIGVNNFKVDNIVNDFSISGIKSALAATGNPCKKMYSDIGIMQKISTRVENGVKYYYTGAYSGDFTCIIKSVDFITWEYVSQPDFINDSKWENATYVLNDTVYYFVRQQDENAYGFLVTYNLIDNKWGEPVQIDDCQSRSDFIYYKGGLYLFHAPIDREHIQVIKVDVNDITKSKVVFQAKMKTSCFYPFIQYYNDELAMSYTVARKHIRIAQFNLSKYLK